MASDSANTTFLQKSTRIHDCNRIQNLFLDRSRILQFYTHIYTHTHPSIYSQCEIRGVEETLEDAYNAVLFEGYYDWNIIIHGHDIEYSLWKGTCEHAECDHDECDCDDHINCDKTCFYDGNKRSYQFSSVYIEIKSLVDDEYPFILRKMNTQIDLTQKKLDRDREAAIEHEKKYDTLFKMNRSYEVPYEPYRGMYYLLIKDYQSSTTSREELIQIFKQSDIHILFLHDVFSDLPLSLSVEKTEPMVMQREPSSSSEVRFDILEKRIAHLEYLLMNMGIANE